MFYLTFQIYVCYFNSIYHVFMLNLLPRAQCCGNLALSLMYLDISVCLDSTLVFSFCV